MKMPCPFAWLSKIFPDLVAPHGMPLTDRSEGSAIALLHGTGLDWRTTLKELAARHGITERDRRSVVPLPPVTTLSNEPLTFYVPYTPEIENHPVSYATATYLAHDDAAKNHTEIVAQIRLRLGLGAPGTSATTLNEEWRFGRIVISATTWPPEKQLPGGQNALHEMEPRLRFATTVNVQSSLSYIFPLADLAVDFDSPETRVFDEVDRPDVVASPFGSLPVRVNPPLLQERLRAGEWRAWRHDGKGWLGVSTPDTTALFERRFQPTLHLTKLTPARGPGGASLRIETVGDWGSAAIFQSARTDGLDALAEKLAPFWELPLSTIREQDE